MHRALSPDFAWERTNVCEGEGSENLQKLGQGKYQGSREL